MTDRLKTKFDRDKLLAGDVLFFISYGLFLTISIPTAFAKGSIV